MVKRRLRAEEQWEVMTQYRAILIDPEKRSFREVQLGDRDNPRFWFQVDAEGNPPSSHPITGYGLVCGVDEDGERCDARISVKELAERMTFNPTQIPRF